jgi:hypothetical protein
MKFGRVVSFVWLAMFAIRSIAAVPKDPNERLHAIGQSEHTISQRAEGPRSL